MGLYTSAVYAESVTEIPFIRGKVAEIQRRSGFDPVPTSARNWARCWKCCPRRPVPDPGGRPVLHRHGHRADAGTQQDPPVPAPRPYGRFAYALAYVPRDVYSTETRLKIQQILMDRLQASDCEFWTFFSESVLARVQFILRLDPKNKAVVDPVRLEKEVIQACRSWKDDYASLVNESFGEAQGTRVLADFPKGFPPATASASPRTRPWSTCSTSTASPTSASW